MAMVVLTMMVLKIGARMGGERMKLEIDKTDYEFVKTMLLRAAAHWELDMVDDKKTQSFRDRARENAKMARQAAEILYGAEKKEGTN